MISRRSATLAIVLSVGCASLACSGRQPEKPASLETNTAGENRLVKQPGEAGEEGKIFLVKGQQRHWITHSSWIGAHGSEYPKGVETVTPAELQAIPLGNAITEER